MKRKKKSKAGVKNKSHKRKRHYVREPRLEVKPSPEIEARVSRETERALSTARALTCGNLFASGYLTSAVYYHDGIFDNFDPANRAADPADRVVASIARALPSDFKRQYVGLLDQLCALEDARMGLPGLVVPVDYEPIGPGRNVHPTAIDLFANEGSPVRAAAGGLVVLAEQGWIPGEWFQTSSMRGGNCVIIYNRDRSLFFRYAHLDSVSVSPGMFLPTAFEIGRVGHTGFNASRPGHGRHLHFEINEFEPRTGLITAWPHDELEAVVEAARLSTWPSTSAPPESAR